MRYEEETNVRGGRERIRRGEEDESMGEEESVGGGERRWIRGGASKRGEGARGGYRRKDEDDK